MKKWVYILIVTGLLVCFLFGCKGSNDAIESQEAPGQESESAVETSETELHAEFEQVYDDCGASVSQEAEQLNLELEALKAKAEASEAPWPQNYETLYKAWRSDTIETRLAAINEEYKQIIAERTLYEVGVTGLWETRPGLFYADYFDLDDDGMQELVLLTWAQTNNEGDTTLEVYGEEKSHAVKCYEQVLDDFFADFPYYILRCSLTVNDNKPFISITTGDSGSWHMTEISMSFSIKHNGLFVADDIVRYEWDRIEDNNGEQSFREQYYYLNHSDAPSISPNSEEIRYTDLYIEISQAQFQSTLDKYGAEESLASFCWGEPTVHDSGVIPLSIIKPVPKIEVNGELLEFQSELYTNNGALMAPLRDVLETMGVSVYASSDASVILASTKSNTLEIYTSHYNNYYSFNGAGMGQLSVQNFGGKLFVPIEIIVSLFGTAQWNSDTKTMEITSDIQPNDYMSQEELNAMANFSSDKAIQIVEQSGYEYRTYEGPQFNRGRAVWIFYVRDEVDEGNFFRVEVANNGEITAYPEEKYPSYMI